MARGIDPAKVVEMYVEKKMSTLQVGEALGCATGTVIHHLKTQGVARRPLKKIDWPVEQMRHWYEDEKWTLQQIADHLGQKQKVVNKVAKRHGFQMRRTGPERGEGHPEWKGGRLIDKSGYVLVYAPDNPMARGKYVLEHRLVMSNHIGRILHKHEVVHHKNDCKTDNRIENLELFQSNAEHLAETLKGKCPNWTPKGRESLKGVWSNKRRVEASVLARRLKRNASSSQQASLRLTSESDTGSREPSQTERMPSR